MTFLKWTRWISHTAGFEGMAKSKGLSVTLSRGEKLPPYGIAYRRVYGPSTSGLFEKSLCNPRSVVQLRQLFRPEAPGLTKSLRRNTERDRERERERKRERKRERERERERGGERERERWTYTYM